MADPLGISVSLITLLQLTKTVIDYIQHVRHLSDDRRRLLVELVCFKGILDFCQTQNVGTLGYDLCRKDSGSPDGWDSLLEQLERLIQRLESRLKLKNGFSRLSDDIAWPFRKTGVAEILASLERFKLYFSIALQKGHISASNSLQAGNKQIEAKLDQIHRSQHKLFNWLSPLDFRKQQCDNLRRRQVDTGDWFLNSVDFKLWVGEPGKTLFCPGIPGAGKTIMASTVIYHLQEVYPCDAVTTFMFCNYKDRASQTAESLFASLLKQILDTKPHPLPETHHLLTDSRSKSQSLTLRELFTHIKAETATFARTFLIVDALDEFEDNMTDTNGFVSQLCELTSSSNINLLVTSRPLLHIEQAFSNANHLRISAASSDIYAYLSERMPQLPGYVLKRIELQEQIKQKITQASDGMFLLAHLLFESLTDKLTPKALLSTLDSLSRSHEPLSTAYDEIIARLNSQKPGFRDAAMKVLAWVVHAERPLTVMELQHAMAIGEEEYSIIDEDCIPDIEDLISCCCGFIIVDQQSQIVRLVHYTAQEYFDARRLSYFPGAQAKIAAACISYLKFSMSSHVSAYHTGASKPLPTYPFLDYAILNWGVHTQTAQEAVLKQTLSLLEKDSFLNIVSQRLPDLFMQTGLRVKAYSTYFTHPWDALNHCAWFGLDLAFNHLLDAKKHWKSPDMICHPSNLHLAAQKGHTNILKLLLDRGIDQEIADDWGYTAICYAALGHHVESYSLLVRRGANVFPNYRISRLMLDRILESKDMKMIEALLDSGNDTSISRESQYQYSASVFGVQPIENCPELVELLLRRGCDLGLSTERREIALENPQKVTLVRRRKWVAVLEGEPLYPDEDSFCNIASISVTGEIASMRNLSSQRMERKMGMDIEFHVLDGAE